VNARFIPPGGRKADSTGGDYACRELNGITPEEGGEGESAGGGVSQ